MPQHWNPFDNCTACGICKSLLCTHKLCVPTHSEWNLSEYSYESHRMINADKHSDLSRKNKQMQDKLLSKHNLVQRRVINQSLLLLSRAHSRLLSPEPSTANFFSHRHLVPKHSFVLCCRHKCSNFDHRCLWLASLSKRPPPCKPERHKERRPNRSFNISFNIQSSSTKSFADSQSPKFLCRLGQHIHFDQSPYEPNPA